MFSKRTFDDVKAFGTSTQREQQVGCFGGFRACQAPGSYNNNEDMELWQKEFNNLDPGEREKILQNMYGMRKTIEEAPELLEEKLMELDDEINAIPNEKKQAYLLAREQAEAENNDYITCDQFKIMFLRSTEYDAFTAAKTIVGHFQLKKRIFGEDCLSKRITLDNLNEEGEECYKTAPGNFCGTDSAGRGIIFVRHHNIQIEDPINLQRAVFVQPLRRANLASPIPLASNLWVYRCIGKQYHCIPT